MEEKTKYDIGKYSADQRLAGTQYTANAGIEKANISAAASKANVLAKVRDAAKLGPKGTDALLAQLLQAKANGTLTPEQQTVMETMMAMKPDTTAEKGRMVGLDIPKTPKEIAIDKIKGPSSTSAPKADIYTDQQKASLAQMRKNNPDTPDDVLIKGMKEGNYGGF